MQKKPICMSWILLNKIWMKWLNVTAWWNKIWTLHLVFTDGMRQNLFHFYSLLLLKVYILNHFYFFFFFTPRYQTFYLIPSYPLHPRYLHFIKMWEHFRKEFFLFLFFKIMYHVQWTNLTEFFFSDSKSFQDYKKRNSAPEFLWENHLSLSLAL